MAASMPVVLRQSSLNYEYGLGMIGWADGAGVFKFVLTDGLGSVTYVLNADGTTDTSYTYDVFGGIRSQGGSNANDFMFAGAPKDDESDYYYLRARYYDTGTGRFLGRDPLGGGYSYVGNNPARRATARH